MSAAQSDPDAQGSLFEVEAARTLLDALLTDSRLYHKSADYKALLDFVVRLRNFAPFNAMLLQVQKPGLTYAASAADWRLRFGRKPKEGARPLLILWPFAPVALVYDVMDTEGEDLAADVAAFFARGPTHRRQTKGRAIPTGFSSTRTMPRRCNSRPWRTSSRISFSAISAPTRRLA